MTQEECKRLLHYNPETGIFTRLVSNNSKVKVGDVVGFKVTDGYLRTKINNITYSLHRLAFLYITGRFPEKHIDHINHIPDDNRWCNLREVSHKENCINRSRRSDNKSGTTGVYYHNKDKRWIATISINGKNKRLGCFINIEKTIKIRKEAEIKYNYHKNHGL